MRLSSISLALILAPLAIATPNLAAESNDAIVKRSPMPMKSLSSSAHVLARSPQDNGEVCSSDEKRCGDACVNKDYTCCPDNVSGGCPSDEECQRDNGKWGCCPDGDDCRWDDDDDDDDDSFVDRVKDGVNDVGDNIKDTWDDIWDDDEDAAGMLKPGAGVALMAAIAAAILPL